MGYRSTLPCISPGSLSQVPALIGCSKGSWVAGNTVWSHVAHEFPIAVRHVCKLLYSHSTVGAFKLQSENLTFASLVILLIIYRFCTVSIAGSFRDFHMEIGGSTAWHSVLRGQEVANIFCCCEMYCFCNTWYNGAIQCIIRYWQTTVMMFTGKPCLSN